jgi:death-on-curing protein
MTIYLSLDQVLAIHRAAIERYGGSGDILDPGKIDSAVAQPQMTFDGNDLYPTHVEKAAALSYSLACNHGFADGNKRTAFGALDLFLRINGFRISATPEEIEAAFVAISDHKMKRDEFQEWVRKHVVPQA